MQKYYGIWHTLTSTWVTTTVGVVMYFPLRSIAEAQLGYMRALVKAKEARDFEVREFKLDSGLVVPS